MCYSIEKFITFFVSFAYFRCTKPQMFKKNIKKYIFDVKLAVLSNATGRIGLNIKDRPENRKNPQLFKKIITYFQIGSIFQQTYSVSTTTEK